MIEDLPFTYLHVFTYSARPGTPAAAMPNQVPVQIARERNRILRELAAAKKQRFLDSFVGRTVEAITLSHDAASADYTEALTDHYLSLLLPTKIDANQWVRAGVTHSHEGKLFGEVLDSTSVRSQEAAFAV
jgi:threonylcarbamoyladenosine tRNA methylthiotransferase MtaB